MGRTFTNSLGMVFVRVEPGTFTMGVPGDPRRADAGSRDYDEPPPHQVTITQPFYALRDRVSLEAYRSSGLPGSANDASWKQAAAFCAWLSRREHRTYRLPTEAEWDWVRRQGAAAHLAGPGEPDGREWVQDWHGIIPPDDAVDPTGPTTGTTKVIRAGARRASLSPDASGSPWGLEPVAFRVVLVTEPPAHPHAWLPPFNQAAIKQSTAAAQQGPDAKLPYFKVRFALPIPPDNDLGLSGPLTGMDPSVMAHQHSPGFEILPNGDALAIYFSARTSSGSNESSDETRFVQARLRYGVDQWDPPELFCDFKPLNDQSALLWTDGNTIRFFGGGRGVSPWLPFKIGVSTNNGATWDLSLPLLDAPANDYTAQPIVNAFHGPGGAIYFAMDAAKAASFLWRSTDNGVHWHDLGGRTGGRHSTIVPLDKDGRLLSIGGKSASLEGWTPQNLSSDWGVTWSASARAAFPALASNQRPCLIRLANGHLCFVSDSCQRKEASAPKGWAHGEGCVVAISKDHGQTWHIKRLPVELPHEADRKHGTLGYATVRQAPNGVIHVLATMTQPCLHYEFNETWIFSEAGARPPLEDAGKVRSESEKYPDGSPRAAWSGALGPGAGYLLQGTETTYYPNGRKEYEANFVNGRKTGEETFWAPDGTRVWSWTHDPNHHRSTWTHYWQNGRKRIESHWNTQPRARDLNRSFAGLVAEGPAYHWDKDGQPVAAYNFTAGALAGSLPLPPAQVAATATKTGGPER